MCGLAGPPEGWQAAGEKQGTFCQTAGSSTFVSQEQKIAFDNVVKGDPQESSNMPRNQKTAFDDIVKSVAQEGLARWVCCQRFLLGV